MIAATTSALVSPETVLMQQHLKPVRLGILASGSGTNFEAIAQAIADQKLQAECCVVVYNNPDAGVIARADRWQVPKVLVNHREFPNRNAFDQRVIEVLQAYQTDWVVMAGWMRLVTQSMIDAFPHRMINIHPSLLPSFKGLHAIEQALEAKVKITGCTVHLVTLEMDSGEILIQAAVPVLPDDTSDTLHARVQVQEHRILPQAIAIATQRDI